MPEKTQLTEHFSLFEARCRCGCGMERYYIPELTAQAALLEAFRTFLNEDLELEQCRADSPAGEIRLMPLSWIRCEKWNEHEGGADNSHHLPTARHHCTATDITSPELPAQILYEKAKQFFSTVIYYRGRGFCHVDRRERAEGPRAWVKAPSETKEPARA